MAAAAAEKSDADPHRSLLDKSWKEGVDYFLAEPSCACHDGESIQGSHLTTHQGDSATFPYVFFGCFTADDSVLGTYLLQWRLHESAGAGGALGARDIIDTLTAHGAKAKLMYFYETLSSDDYKVPALVFLSFFLLSLSLVFLLVSLSSRTIREQRPLRGCLTRKKRCRKCRIDVVFHSCFGATSVNSGHLSMWPTSKTRRVLRCRRVLHVGRVL